MVLSGGGGRGLVKIVIHIQNQIHLDTYLTLEVTKVTSKSAKCQRQLDTTYAHVKNMRNNPMFSCRNTLGRKYKI